MAAQAPTEELSKLSVSDAAAKPTKPGPDTATATNGNLNRDDDDSDDDAENAAVDAAATGAAKKKKKRKPKKKKKAPTAQSDPPRVLISQLFPNDSYPKGEEVEYVNENSYRTTSDEKRHLENITFNSEFLTDYRHAAEAHRQTRKWAREFIQPGKGLTEVADGIEDSVRALVGHSGLEEGDGLKAGMGFPTGLSINHCAAHYNPNAGNKMVIQQEDVLKVDIGVHVNGRIVDSAFTLAWNPRYDPLLDAVKAATNAGIKEAGIDARLGEIGGVIQEVMESYEVELDGTSYPVKSIRNLNGHTINHYSIHGSKSVPIVKSNDQTKMEEGDVFAIETFGSTGNGYVREEGEVSHYAKRGDAQKVDLRISSAKTLLNVINKNFGTLPFCRRYLDRLGQEKYLLGLNNLIANGIVESYPPLVDKKGSYTAQYEHTILIRPTVKEVISRGDDY
ncbi:methionine aminopeptidase 2-like protein [Immersiella caudata]|uniref:Methionine aminopeptidase 2 n=1 Tax=Immersiella caudata TaxID=314043 RepID=A0AA39X496_9PEZI|nr:methionine aminopeptidase 2-like protein [Immersiella caudata]